MTGSGTIDKLLIANRGEIALRIQRACRSLGIRSVQAYSQADAKAPYAALADEAVCIGPATASKSYLDAASLIRAAEASGADAIHPGYGFLSENADFSALVERFGLIFVGPNAQAIRTMGDKIRAKEAMIEAGVPCIPGSRGALPDSAQSCLSLAEEVGYPVIIKAAGGGGGRGMRVVRTTETLMESIRTTREEASKAFGNPDLYMERYLGEPRHVEIQVLCDHHGNGVWLGERDCSLQRRHQKVVEEAPAPGIDRDLVAKVAERCLDACRNIGYRGAGTFEFLYEKGELFFIEMNTRLQVEHPVTEAVTGIDLVQAQLRIAAGERLWFGQDDVRLVGHAVECRLNAEDPATFAPSPGTVSLCSLPAGLGIRVDSHISSGYVVPPNYDSLLGKIITYGRTREEAIERMRGALRDTLIEGVRTNLELHGAILQDPAFLAGGPNIHHLESVIAPNAGMAS
jgi:acetyl-CoA carboxylase, biotin carboxylase subunit